MFQNHGEISFFPTIFSEFIPNRPLLSELPNKARLCVKDALGSLSPESDEFNEKGLDAFLKKLNLPAPIYGNEWKEIINYLVALMDGSKKYADLSSDYLGYKTIQLLSVIWMKSKRKKIVSEQVV